MEMTVGIIEMRKVVLGRMVELLIDAKAMGDSAWERLSVAAHGQQESEERMNVEILRHHKMTFGPSWGIFSFSCFLLVRFASSFIALLPARHSDSS
jgi:hypothetical protein